MLHLLYFAVVPVYHFVLLFHVLVSSAQRWIIVGNRVGSVAGSGSTDIFSELKGNN